MRISERELKAREAKRDMILNMQCPHCQGPLKDASERFVKTAPRYIWRECMQCHTVMGVTR